MPVLDWGRRSNGLQILSDDVVQAIDLATSHSQVFVHLVDAFETARGRSSSAILELLKRDRPAPAIPSSSGFGLFNFALDQLQVN